MCRLVCKAVNHGNMQVLNDVRSILKIKTYIPSDPNELCNRIFVTCYMGTENSSEDTKERAKLLSKDIGSYHLGGSFVLCKALFWSSQSTTDKSTLIPPNFLVGKFCAKAQFPAEFQTNWPKHCGNCTFPPHQGRRRNYSILRSDCVLNFEWYDTKYSKWNSRKLLCHIFMNS